METTQRKSVIYALYAFDGKGPRYCGHTVNPKARLNGHKRDNSHTHKVYWIQSIGPENVHMSILEITTPERAPEREMFYIKRLKEMGFKLTNLTDGGEGIVGYISTPERNDKISRAHKGMVFSKEHCANIATARLGTKSSQETKDKIAAAGVGRVHSAETKAKMSASKIGKKRSPEACAAISAGKKGKRPSPETLAKMSASHMGNTNCLGYIHSAEACANMGASHRGKKRSPEACAIMVIAQQKRAQREKESGVKRTRSPEACAKTSLSLLKHYHLKREQRGGV